MIVHQICSLHLRENKPFLYCLQINLSDPKFPLQLIIKQGGPLLAEMPPSGKHFTTITFIGFKDYI